MVKRRIEILAPAGDGDMLRAAVFSGADSVYLGVQGFNARRGAQNFDADALRQAVAFCHARGCGVYAALNTLVQPGEEGALADAVRGVAGAGCDAIIVQDLATALAVQRQAPGLALHASTQMSVHSLAGVQKLAELGFSRAILARELTAGEIAHIAAASPIELEVFVHGALCVCVSGQCCMSAFLGGRSANRGACAGPCRLPFRAEGPGEEGARPAGDQHHLSLKDLSVLDSLPELEAMGVVSAKIEGRLRGPEYCAVVVDAAQRARAGQPYDKALLADVFSRSGFTRGWYDGQRGKAMFGTRTETDTAALKTALPAARALYRRERPRVPVEMALTLTPAGAQLCVCDPDGNRVQADSPAPLAPAQKDPAEALARALGKTGGTPFYVHPGDVTIQANGLFLAGAAANALRREALEALLAKRQADAFRPLAGRVNLLKNTALPPLPALLEQQQAAPPAPKLPSPPRLRARFESVEATPGQAVDLCDALLLPLAAWRQVPEPWRGKTWLTLPRVLFGQAEAEAAAAVKQAAAEGFAGFEVQGLSHLALCAGQPLVGGFGLNVINAGALALYTALGCTLTTLSVELSLEAMAAVAAAVPVAQTDLLAYGHLPLMLTRAAPLANGPGGEAGSLVDRRGKRFAVECRGGVSEIYNPVSLWMGDRLAALPTHSATLYFTRETPEEAVAVLRAFREGRPASGEFTRGLYAKGTV